MYKQKRKKTSSQVICQLFHLPRPETIYQDYSCSYIGGISFFGRIYVGEEHFCFNSNMFGIAKHFSITIDQITKLELEKGRILGVCKHDDGQEESFIFGNFVNVEFTFKLMYGLWKGERVEAKILGTNEEEKEEKEGELEQGSAVEVDFFNKEVSFSDKQILAKITFPCSVTQYYDFFLSDKASLLSAMQYLQLKNAQNIRATEWKKNQQFGRQVRQINALIKVSGVPMKSQANMHQIQTLLWDQKGIDLSLVTQMHDVPYAAYFTVQINQKIRYIDENQKKCSLEVQAWLTFNKSTMMRKMITDKTSKDLKQDYQRWIKTVQDKLKSKIKRTGSAPVKGDSTLQYQNAEGSVMNFSKILEGLDEKQKPVLKNEVGSVVNRRVQMKVNIILCILCVLVVMNIHSYFR